MGGLAPQAVFSFADVTARHWLEQNGTAVTRVTVVRVELGKEELGTQFESRVVSFSLLCCKGGPYGRTR